MKRAFASTFQSQRVDRANGVIFGVSVITEGEAKGHGCYVDAICLQQMKRACEEYDGGLKVVDRHTRGTDSVFSAVGFLKNFRIDGRQLRADLHVLKTEEGRDKLLEMAETMPDTFGLSVAFSGVEETINGKQYSRCSEIYNAALVDVPAANPNGLFSASGKKPVPAKEMTPKELAAEMAARTQRIEMAEKMTAHAVSEFNALSKHVNAVIKKIEEDRKKTIQDAVRAAVAPYLPR